MSSIRRVLLCNRTQIPSKDSSSSSSTSTDPSPIDIIDLRHFSISTKPVGVPRTVRKTSVKSTLPNLSNLTDVADFVLTSQDYDSASEIDEDEKVEVKVPNVKREVAGTQQRAIKLTEIGPRLRLELVKIEEGMCDGKVLFHRYVRKTKVFNPRSLAFSLPSRYLHFSYPLLQLDFCNSILFSMSMFHLDKLIVARGKRTRGETQNKTGRKSSTTKTTGRKCRKTKSRERSSESEIEEDGAERGGRNGH